MLEPLLDPSPGPSPKGPGRTTSTPCSARSSMSSISASPSASASAASKAARRRAGSVDSFLVTDYNSSHGPLDWGSRPLFGPSSQGLASLVSNMNAGGRNPSNIYTLRETLHESRDKPNMEELRSGSQKPERLPFSCIFGYSLGHVLNDMCAACWFTYLLIYLTQVAKLSSTNAGIVFFFGQGADAIATPIVGILSDKTANRSNTNRQLSSGSLALIRNFLGPRKFGHLIGTVIVSSTFICMFGQFILPTLEQTIVTVYASAFASLFNIGWATIQVSHMAMVPELTCSDAERVVLNGGRYAFTIISNLLVFATFYICSELISPKGALTDAKFFMLALVCVCVGVGCTLVFYVNVPDHAKPVRSSRQEMIESGSNLQDNDADQQSAGGVGVHVDKTPEDDVIILDNFASCESDAWGHGDSSTLPMTKPPGSPQREQPTHWSKWFSYSAFYLVAFLYCMSRLLTNVSQVYLPYYVLDYTKMGSSALAFVPLTVYLSSLVYTVSLNKIDSNIGRYNNFMLGCVFVLGSCTLLYSATHNTSGLVYAASVLLGFGSAATMVSAVSMESDLIGKNTETAAFVFGALSFTDKLSSGIAILVVQLLQNPLEGDDDDDPCSNSTCSSFVRNVLVFIPAVSALCALCVCLFMKVTDALKLSL